MTKGGFPILRKRGWDGLTTAVIWLFVLIGSGELARGAYDFVTFSGTAGTGGQVDGIGAAARFSAPGSLAVDGAGNVYVADWFTVRKVTPAGAVTTLAGSPVTRGAVDGTGTAALFTTLSGIALAPDGAAWVSDGHAIRRVSAAGVVTTVAGAVSETGAADGAGAAARFYSPTGLAVDAEGNVLVADHWNGTIRRVTPAGVVTTVAGKSPGGGWGGIRKDGVGAEAGFGTPDAVALDVAGNLWISDGGWLRRMTPAGVVTTLALKDSSGTEVLIQSIGGMAFASDGSLLASTADDLIWSIAPSGVATPVAGQLGQNGAADGVGGAARFYAPAGVAFDAAGNLYVGDGANRVIRKATQTNDVSPPIFLQQKVGGTVTVGVGSRLTKTVKVSSAAPATYQWFRDGVAIDGATLATLEISQVKHADHGNYSVTVSNSGGGQSLEMGAVTVYTAPILSFSMRRSVTGGSFLRAIAAGDGWLIAVGSAGRILRSPDGVTWTTIDSRISDTLRGVTYGLGQFVAVGDNGLILRSVDGSIWTRVAASGTTAQLNSVCYGQGWFVAVGENGTILKSPDGEAWVPNQSGVTQSLRAVACNPRLGGPIDYFGLEFRLARYAAAGINDTVIAAADNNPETWYGMAAGVSRISGDFEGLAATAGGYVGVGATGVWLSGGFFGGGTTFPQLAWNSAPTGWPTHLRAVAVGPDAYVAVGDGGMVLARPNSVALTSWALIPSGTNADLAGAVFVGNSLFVVGADETILQSDPLPGSRLINLSTRGQAGRDDATLINGFVIAGAGSKQVLLRAVGPGLRSYGVAEVAPAPGLTLFDSSGRAIATNRGWSTAANADAIRAAAVRTGAFPLSGDEADAALLVALPPGRYTTQVDPRTGGEGICLVEFYDADETTGGSKTVNISARGDVGSGDRALIAGLVLGGNAARRVLIRVAGPDLQARAGLVGVLARPRFTIHRVDGAIVDAGGAWSEAPAPEELRDAMIRAGAAPFAAGSADAATVATLSPGIYTIVAGGIDGSTGLALIEVFELP